MSSLYLSSSLLFHQIEYFIYLNLWLVTLFYWMFIFSSLILSSLFFLSSLYNIDGFIEYFLLFIYLFLLIIVLGQCFIILSSFIFSYYFSLSSFSIFISGLQWSWDSKIGLAISIFISFYVILDSLSFLVSVTLLLVYLYFHLLVLVLVLE